MAFKLSDFSSGAALAEAGLSVAQRVGKWGIPGIVLYCLSSILRVVQHPTWDTIEGALSTWGIGLVLVSILASVKRGNDITVNAAVDAKEDRAAIALAVGAPPAPATSSDKAIQSEINTRLATDPTESARLTPLNGTPVQKG
jgi:hypothetical protein